MASPEAQQIWIPFETNKDCSQGFCSIYCPQWCYIMFPPPPPFGFPDEDSDPNFSPMVIAIIGILASAFLLVSYYTVVAKYCGNFDSLRRRIHRNPHENLEENQNRTTSQNDQWHVASTGLDETLIKSITVCKYKRGDGLVEGTDCSVCLNEFQEDESLRLLPKCSHAFHLPCIDTWLQTHSNCPLCRANITSPPQPQQIQPPEEIPSDGVSAENRADEELAITVDGLSSVPEETPLDSQANFEGEVAGSVVSNSKVNFRALSDLGVGVSEQDSIIEIRDEEIQPIRRSISMDSSCGNRVSIADILGMSSNEDFPAKDFRIPAGYEWSKRPQGKGRIWREAYSNRILHSVKAPMAMKRSVSGGKLFTGHGRGKNCIIPV